MISLADAWQVLRPGDLLTLLAGLGLLLFLAIQILSVVKHFRPQWIRGSVETREREEWARKSELQKLELDLRNELKETRQYFADEMHKLRTDFQGFLLSGEAQREGIHGRINVVCEVLYELRGIMKERPKTS